MLLSIFSSCEKVGNIEKEPLILIPNTAKLTNLKNMRQFEVNTDIDNEALAILIAVSLKDKELRKMLKMEINKKFDGDYDFLLTNKLNVSNGSDKLIERLKLNSLFKNETINNAFKNELLNISIPVHIDKWEEKNQMPLVAVATNVEENVTKFIKAFDANGKSYLIDAQNEPNLPVIIIGKNERVNIVNGKIINKYTNKKSTSFSSSRLLSCTYPFRQNNNYEVLKGMKFSNLSDYESWVKGSPEIGIWVVAPTSPNNYNTVNAMYEAHFEGPDRRDINDKFWNITIPLFYWDSPNKANTILFQFIEEDTGNSYTVNLGLGTGFTTGISTPGSSSSSTSGNSVTPTIGFSTTFKDGDDIIGKTTVEQFICPYNQDNSYQIGTAFYFKSSN